MASKRVFISVGETSGDMHAASLLQSFTSAGEHVCVEGIAGPMMRAHGCHAVADMEELNVMGIVDVLRALPRIRKVEQRIRQHLQQHRPDLVVLVDFPGFNMRLGRMAKRMGIPVLYYIAPKLWAWGAWRVRKLKQAQDRLACILPFEPAWFAAHGVQAEYVGNPSAFACLRNETDSWSSLELKRRLGVSADIPVLALLPGSRPSELQRHVPLLRDVFVQLQTILPQVHAVTSCAPGVSRSVLAPLMDAGVHIIDRTDAGFALRTDAAVAVSGTATLELALWDVPTVLVYRSTPLSMAIGKCLLQTWHVGLANIILDDQTVMPELLQEQASVENILSACAPLLDASSPEAQAQRNAFIVLRERLGAHHPAAVVAAQMWDMLEEVC